MSKEICLFDEHNGDFQAFVGMVLGGEGYSVRAYERSQDLVERVRQVKSELVIIRLFPPRGLGLELARFLRDEPPLSDIPRLLVTAKWLDERRIPDLHTLVQDVLQEPFNIDVLLEKVNNLTQGR